jgi:RING finger family protein
MICYKPSMSVGGIFLLIAILGKVAPAGLWADDDDLLGTTIVLPMKSKNFGSCAKLNNFDSSIENDSFESTKYYIKVGMSEGEIKNYLEYIESLKFKDDENIEGSCPVCKDELADKIILTLPCGHTYHKECIAQLLKKIGSCKICNNNQVIETCTLF